MTKEFFEQYKKSLIISGADSKRLKKLPKNPKDLSIAEFYFLIDYMTKAMESVKL